MPGQELKALLFLQCPEQPLNGEIIPPMLCVGLSSGQEWRGEELRVSISSAPETAGSTVRLACQG